MKILKALLSTCVLLVYSFSQVLAAPPGPPGAHLDVTQVFVDDPDNPTSIMIIGTDLDFGSGPLSVTLGEFGALTVTGTPSDTLIEADRRRAPPNSRARRHSPRKGASRHTVELDLPDPPRQVARTVDHVAQMGVEDVVRRRIVDDAAASTRLVAKEDLNCLEVPAGRFDVTARYYLPEEPIISGEWKMPGAVLQDN